MQNYEGMAISMEGRERRKEKKRYGELGEG